MSKSTAAPATAIRIDELTPIIDEGLPDLTFTSILIIIKQNLTAELRTRFVNRRQAAIFLQRIPRKWTRMLSETTCRRVFHPPQRRCHPMKNANQ